MHWSNEKYVVLHSGRFEHVQHVRSNGRATKGVLHRPENVGHDIVWPVRVSLRRVGIFTSSLDTFLDVFLQGAAQCTGTKYTEPVSRRLLSKHSFYMVGQKTRLCMLMIVVISLHVNEN